MTEAVIFVVAILTLDSAILAALYGIARDTPQPQRQSYSRRRPWNFK